MDMLIVVSTDRGAQVAASLAKACVRRGTSWACFFTNDGVKALGTQEVAELVSTAHAAIACEHSWHRFMEETACPVELGSQTNHSALVAQAARIVTL